MQSLRYALVVVMVMAWGIMPVSTGFAQAPSPRYVPGELLVQFKTSIASAQAETVARLYGAVKVEPLRPAQARGLSSSPLERWYHVTLAPGLRTPRVLQRLATNLAVERVELNYKVSIRRVPNDPSFPTLWGLHNTGQSGGTAGADIDAPAAWDLATACSAVLVAVIDTGSDATHPDLAANIWTNPGEIPGNGIDDDGNGYVDDAHGYDFVNRDGDPKDDNSHGTHVAGTIAAVGDNGMGVAGVCWKAKVMAVKFLDATGSGNIANAIKAILYATDMGARILNNSWGGYGFSQALKDAIAEANAAGALFVVAAGNGGFDSAGDDNDVVPFYPASYDVPNILAVAATDRNDRLTSFSNYGARSVDLGAPGVNILSTVPGGGYGYKSGTSMATPHVAGAAALVWGQAPTLDAQAVRAVLLQTVDPVPALAGKTVSGGRVNVHRAVQAAPPGALLPFEDHFDAGARAEWGNQQGQWVAQAGRYFALAPQNTRPTYTSITSLSELTDFIVDVDIAEVVDGGIWLRSHLCPNGQVAGVLLVTGGGGRTYNGLYWHKWTCEGGWGPVLNQVDVPGLQGSNMHVTIVVEGNTYTAYLNHAPTPTTALTTSDYASGAVGLYGYSAQRFDNVAIRSLLLFEDYFETGARQEWGNEAGVWVAHDGVYQAQVPNNNPPAVSSVTSQPELTDFIVEVDIQRASDGGVFLRSHRCANGYMAGVLLVTGGYGRTYNGLYWHISECTGWGPVYNPVDVPGLQESDLHLAIVVQDNTYTAYLNGATTPLTTLMTDRYASGAVALYSYSAQTFDNVTIQGLD